MNVQRIASRIGRERRGTGSLELLVGVAILMLGVLAFARTMLESAELEEQNESVGSAVLAARGVVERMSGTDFGEVYAAFNETQDDDGTVLGTVYGADFAVAGLTPMPGDADGLVGQVRFPIVDVGGVPELREDLVDAALGMPRDLNLDGVIDGLDHSSDYRVLPVSVRVEWREGRLDQEFEITTILGAR